MNGSKSFFSNTCIGWCLFNEFDIHPYNNPFIGSLIQNDLDYIKLINNLSSYIDVDPIVDEPKQNYYQHPEILIPYPVIFLGDIEIHYIHEKDDTVCLEKFLKRWQRFRSFLKENNDVKMFAVLSFSEFLNDHDNIEEIIDAFLQPSVNSNVTKIFLGPTKYNIKNYENYINVDAWDNVELTRNQSNVYNFNNQPFTIKLFYDYIKTNDS
jgi:uncharacterized protein (DUF1919 family)